MCRFTALVRSTDPMGWSDLVHTSGHARPSAGPVAGIDAGVFETWLIMGGERP
jgi:hypothetical protein